MSTIKVDAYLDASGGTTAKINGITPINAAGVLPATAAATAYAIGTYAFAAGSTSSGNIFAGATVAGSYLRLSDSQATVGAALTGTWLNVGGSLGSGGGPATLFLRVS